MKNLDKVELMEKIALIAEESVKFKDFNADELEFFYESYELAKQSQKLFDTGYAFIKLLCKE